MNRMIKTLLIMLSIMVCASYAAVVADNDGSAFITKAEFDSLKNNFQNQLDQYNTAIDNKIDAAIASYLAGIKTEKVTNLSNKYVDINPVWMKDKRFNKSKKGTKYTAYFSFIEMTLTDDRMLYMFEGTGSSWYRVTAMTKNEADQEYLYRVSKKKISTFDNQWSLTDLIKCDYTITIIGGAGGGRGGSIDANDRLVFGAATTFAKGTNQYFSTWYDTLPLEVWQVNPSTLTKVAYIDNVGGSAGNGEQVAVSSVASDTLEDEDTLFYLAGGSMTNDIMYCLNQDEVSLLGDKFETAKSNHGSTRNVGLNDDGSAMAERMNWQFRDYGGYASAYDGSIQAEVYRHKVEEINSTSLLNEIITQNIGKKTYYYSGCPLFTATADASVKFKIKFNNTLNARTKWALKASQFTNAANPGDCDDIENCNITDFETNSGTTVEVKFDVKKGTTYWIKAEPLSGYSTISFDGDIVQTEVS